MTLSNSFFTLVAKLTPLFLLSGQVYANQPLNSESSAPTAPAATTALTESAAAQLSSTDAATAEDEYATQANVELIVFQRLFDQDSLNQKFPELNSVIPLTDAVLPSADQLQARALAANEMQLNDIFTKFQQHEAYIPFYHQAWTQALGAQSAAFPIRIQSDPAAIPAIDGRLLIWQDEKIELNFNLAFSYNTQADAQEQQQAFGSLAQETATVPDIDAINTEDNTEEKNNRTQRHTIQYQSQSSYSDNQMMYFDHPLFGILVLISSADGKPLKGVNSENNGENSGMQ
ncbi:CsiV family protein [Pasteurella testudinis]|uniref:CsiV family protein n=1 Tax=Pasteurella testudinis TaxID=761 RepID=UPI004059233B